MTPTPSGGDGHNERVLPSNEPVQERTPRGDAITPNPVPLASAARQLPPGGTKINRISQHTKGLVQDMTSWVELKMKLAQLEMLEQVDARVAEVKKEAVAVALGAVGGLFALLALALGLSAILVAIGLSYPLSYFLGFFLVAVFFLMIAASVHRARSEKENRKVTVDESKLALDAPKGERQLPATLPTE